MGDATSSCTIRYGPLPSGITQVTVEADATVDNEDTISLTLASYGIKVLLGAEGLIHTTANSVLVVENPTTSVSSGVLTLTVGGSTANKQRTYYVYGRGQA